VVSYEACLSTDRTFIFEKMHIDQQDVGSHRVSPATLPG
jgi:hypothetical protein